MLVQLPSMYCPYCKRHTSITPAPMSASYRGADIMVKAIYNTNSSHWWIGICNYCHEPVLVGGYGTTITAIYPLPQPTPSDSRIPDSIRKDLDEAKRCMASNAFRACAVMARRAIQATCIDQGSHKDRLVDQLQEMVTKGIITNDLKSWADAVRWIGNDAAHPEPAKEVERKDAEDILHLADQFLHVIYVTPAIAKEQATKRNKVLQ